MTSLVLGGLILESLTPSVNVFLGVLTMMVVYVDIGAHGNIFLCSRRRIKFLDGLLYCAPTKLQIMNE
jgi:hypothetical protein